MINWESILTSVILALIMWLAGNLTSWIKEQRKRYDTLEEPEFKDYQLAKIWHYLIVSGLTHEITNRGTHHKLAKQQLAKILNVNIAHYRYLDDDTRDYKLLTIKNYEDRKNYQKNWQRENKEKNQ